MQDMVHRAQCDNLVAAVYIEFSNDPEVAQLKIQAGTGRALPDFKPKVEALLQTWKAGKILFGIVSLTLMACLHLPQDLRLVGQCWVPDYLLIVALFNYKQPSSLLSCCRICRLSAFVPQVFRSVHALLEIHKLSNCQMLKKALLKCLQQDGSIRHRR